MSTLDMEYEEFAQASAFYPDGDDFGEFDDGFNGVDNEFSDSEQDDFLPAILPALSAAAPYVVQAAPFIADILGGLFESEQYDDEFEADDFDGLEQFANGFRCL